MKSVTCPHCKTHRIVTARMPKDVVVVVPCPACQELVVMFRNKAIALSRKVLEEGSFEERKEHVAGIIAEFIEPGMLLLDPEQASDRTFGIARGAARRRVRRKAQEDQDDLAQPITERELEKFIRVDLNSIDDDAYFRKHFG